MKIEYLGHSAFNIITPDGISILIDPFITNNPKASVSVDSLNPDVILVTHGHFDHFGDCIKIAQNTGAIIVANYAISSFLNANNFTSVGMNVGGQIELTSSVKIRMVKAEHSSEFNLKPNVDGGTAVGFIITLEDNTKIYHAGDTGLFGDMKTVIGDVYKPDVAIIPIGDKYTMGIEDAAIATKWLNSKYVIPMHYNTFQELEQDTDKFKQLVYNENENTEVIILDSGDCFEI